MTARKKAAAKKPARATSGLWDGGAAAKGANALLDKLFGKPTQKKGKKK